MKNKGETVRESDRVGVRETLAPRGSILRRMMMVAGLAVAGVLGWAGKGEADTFEDYVASYAPENLRPMSPEVNRPGVLGLDSCALSPDGTLFRWREVVSGTNKSIREIPITLNSDGTISVIPPVQFIYGPDAGNYRDSFITAEGHEFLNLGTISLQRDGIYVLNRRGAMDGFDFGETTPYPFGSSIALDFNDGEVRSGLTPDTGDIGIFPENYSGPPMPITTNTDFLANVTPIRELNTDPADPAEALIQIRAVFGQLTGHAFVTEFCGRGLGDCIRTPDQATWDIFMYGRDEITGSWIPATKTRVASTLRGYDRASCVLDNEFGECIFLDGNRFDYACHLKDDDDDEIINFRDNCRVIRNPDQSNLDGDLRGDVCDPCPEDATDDASDIDGVCDNEDNCLGVSNADQSDRDLDSIGDACDACADDPENDIDGDRICGNIDNCPNISNPGQENTYGDARGDACEPPPVDAGVDGGRDGGVDAGSDAVDSGNDSGDSGVDAGTDGNIDAGIDAGADADTDVKSDAEMDAGDEPSDAGVDGDSGNDVVDENSDTHDGGRTEITIPPPHKPGCACNVHGKTETPKGLLIGFGLAVARILRRKKLSRNS